MKVYIAAPYSAETPELIEANVDKVLAVAVRLTEKGYSVFVPHLTHHVDLKAKEMGIDIPHDEWVRLDLEWLANCDAMLVLDLSPGVRREIQFAKRHSIPLCDSLDQLDILKLRYEQ